MKKNLSGRTCFYSNFTAHHNIVLTKFFEHYHTIRKIITQGTQYFLHYFRKNMSPIWLTSGKASSPLLWWLSTHFQYNNPLRNRISCLIIQHIRLCYVVREVGRKPKWPLQFIVSFHDFTLIWCMLLDWSLVFIV